MYGGGQVQPETSTSWPIPTGSGLNERKAHDGTFFGTTAEAGRQIAKVPDSIRIITKTATVVPLVALFEFLIDLIGIFFISRLLLVCEPKVVQLILISLAHLS
jgi:hypothetical protein